MSSTVQGAGGIITDGLVLYLDAANPRSYVSGSLVWNDLSRNSYSGSLINGPTFDYSNGGSIAFDGVNDYINYQKTSNVDNLAQGNMTLCVWVKLDTSTPTFARRFLSKRSNINFDGWIFAQNTDNTVIFSTIVGVSSNANFIGTTKINTNIPLYICASYNGTQRNGKLYVNGIEEVLSTNKVGTLTPPDESDNTLKIGASFDTLVSRFLKGNMYCTMIYNRALSSQEILQNYNAQKARFGL